MFGISSDSTIFSSACTFLRGYDKIKVTANSCVALSSVHKRSEHFIGAHNETLSVAVRVNDPDRSAVNVQNSDPA